LINWQKKSEKEEKLEVRTLLRLVRKFGIISLICHKGKAYKAITPNSKMVVTKKNENSSWLFSSWERGFIHHFLAQATVN